MAGDPVDIAVEIGCVRSLGHVVDIAVKMVGPDARVVGARPVDEARRVGPLAIQVRPHERPTRLVGHVAGKQRAGRLRQRFMQAVEQRIADTDFRGEIKTGHHGLVGSFVAAGPVVQLVVIPVGVGRAVQVSPLDAVDFLKLFEQQLNQQTA